MCIIQTFPTGEVINSFVRGFLLIFPPNDKKEKTCRGYNTEFLKLKYVRNETSFTENVWNIEIPEW